LTGFQIGFDGYRFDLRQPAATASASEQNQRSPLALLIFVRL
jgi:hypothetical protein